jgi:hypothetical protein
MLLVQFTQTASGLREPIALDRSVHAAGAAAWHMTLSQDQQLARLMRTMIRAMAMSCGADTWASQKGPLL